MKRSVKLFSLLMALLVTMAFTPLGIVAESDPIEHVYEEGWGTWYYIVEDGGATLTNYGGDGESFYLPDTLGGYPLKVIGESACAYQDWLTEVDIPDSVVEICYGAFEMCTFLETVNMGDNLEVIGEAAFRGCEFLTDVNFGAGVKVIENNAFDSCYSLKEIAIPDGVEVLSDRTFDRCSGLQNVYLPDSLYFIGNDAFSLCESLREITIPEGVTYIGEYAFNGCSSLEQIALPATVGYIQEAAFRFCDSLTDVYYSGTQEARDFINIQIENDPLYDATWHYGWIGPMPPLEEKPATSGGQYLYYLDADNNAIITGYGGDGGAVVVPNEMDGHPVVGIEYGTFSYSGVTSVVIPEGVTYIDTYVLVGCENLVSVTLPSTLESIGESAFEGCTSLDEVNYNGTEEQAALIAIGTQNDALLNATWRYADGGEEPEIPETDFVCELVDGKITIVGYTGAGGEVVIPTSIGAYPVVTIGNDAFKSNMDITVVQFPEGLVSIGSHAFAFCENLITIELSSTIQTIGASAFSFCENLTEVIIPDSVTTIGQDAFTWCFKVEKIVIGDGVETIEDGTFDRAFALTDLTIGKNVKTIGAQAFNECRKLSALTIPNGVITIGEFAFESCPKLAAIAIPDSVVTIGDYAFARCVAATTISIGKGVTTIGERAFSDCDSVTEMVIPAKVTSIGDKAFAFNNVMTDIHVVEENPVYSSLDGVLFNKDKTVLIYFSKANTSSYVIPNGVLTIGKGAFYDQTGLTMVTLPDGVTTVEESAFTSCTGLTTVTLPDSVTTVGKLAFADCRGLTTVVMGEGLTTIGENAFSGCIALTSVTIPGSVTTVGKSAFADCRGLTTVVMGEGLTTIGENAFSGCIALTSVTIPGTVDRIEMSAFENCRKLSSVVLAYSGRLRLVVETNAFANCTGLTNVWYGGTEVNKRGINIHSNNDAFQNANWYYDCTELEVQYDEEVEHSTMDTESGTGLAFKFDLSVSVGVKNGNEVDYTDATIEYMGHTCKLVGMGSVVTNQEGVDSVLENVNGTTVIDVPVVYLTEWDADSCSFAIRIINIPDTQLERAIYARPYYIIEANGEQIVVYGEVNSACASEFMA